MARVIFFIVAGIFFIYAGFMMKSVSYGPIRRGAQKYQPTLFVRVMTAGFGLILIIAGLVSAMNRA